MFNSQILSFYCEVQDKLGNTLSSSFNCDVRPPVGEHEIDGAVDLPFRRVLLELRGMKRGQTREIHLRAEDAYGLYDDRLLITVPISNLDVEGPLEVGSEVLAESDTGSPQLFRVVAISSSCVTLDGNHPLAGQDLVVRVRVTSARRARKSRNEINVPLVSSSGRILH